MDVNNYLGRVYSNPPCWECVSDIFREEFNIQLLEKKVETMTSKEYATLFRIAIHNNEHGFERITHPEDYALVLMGKAGVGEVHHAGVYYNGCVVHAIHNAVVCVPLFNIYDNYGIVQFWKYKGMKDG